MRITEDDLLEELRVAKAEMEQWKKVAFYLANCHAATASHEGNLKSTSKSRRRRYQSICMKALGMLTRKDLAPALTRDPGFEAMVLEGLADSINDCKDD